MKPAKALSWRQLSWCLALALSLLVTQFAGQRHRIDHTRWGNAGGVATALNASWLGNTDATHSCIALDAATLGDSVGGTLSLAAPVLLGATLIVLPACHSWAAAFKPHFRSRAPPSLS